MRLRALLVLLVLLIAGFVLVGYWNGTWSAPKLTAQSSTTVEKARERGAELGEKAAVATAKVQETMAEAAITAKIKAKMALDDSVKARGIDVSTNGSTVTLSGTVHSSAEHDRAVALARETNGITKVIDHLRVEQ